MPGPYQLDGSRCRVSGLCLQFPVSIDAPGGAVCIYQMSTPMLDHSMLGRTPQLHEMHEHQ